MSQSRKQRMAACWELDDAQEYKQSFRIAETLAEEGYSPAQNLIAIYFEHGLGVTQDNKRAVDWYTKSAKQGNLRALYNLGITYYYGRIGIPKSPEKTVAYLLKAAERGHSRSQYWLGAIYETGTGAISPNEELSFKWYSKAAQQGLADAQFALSCLYDEKKQYLASFQWCRKAALQGDANAKYNMGYNYERGCGVDKDPDLAFQWYLEAAEDGNAVAQYVVGSEYYYGEREINVMIDRALGLSWLRKAAEQQNKDAQETLADMRDEEDPDALTYYHIALCYRYDWALKDDEDATSERKYLELALWEGYSPALFELGQLYERQARRCFAKANAHVSLSLSFMGLIDLLSDTTDLPFELSIICLSFLEKEVELVTRLRKRKRLEE